MFKSKIVNCIIIAILILVVSFFIVFGIDEFIKDNKKDKLLEEVEPQIVEIHNDKFSYLRKQDTEVRWEDNDLIVIYKIKLPSYLENTIERIDKDFSRKYPEISKVCIAGIVTDLQYMCEYYTTHIVTDQDYIFTIQLLLEDDRVYLWTDQNTIIYCMADLSEEGGVEYVGSPSPDELIDPSLIELTPYPYTILQHTNQE